MDLNFIDIEELVTLEDNFNDKKTIWQNIKKVYFGCSNERFGGTGSVLNVHKDRFKLIVSIILNLLQERFFVIFYFKSLQWIWGLRSNRRNIKRRIHRLIPRILCFREQSR